MTTSGPLDRPLIASLLAHYSNHTLRELAHMASARGVYRTAKTAEHELTFRRIICGEDV